MFNSGQFRSISSSGGLITMDLFLLSTVAVASVLMGGLISALSMRSNRRFSIHGRTEAVLVVVIMGITAAALGIALTGLVGAESWSLPLQGFYTIALGGVGLLAEDWLESQIGDSDPLKNQHVARR